MEPLRTRDNKRLLLSGLLLAWFCMALAAEEMPAIEKADKVEVIISPCGFAPSAKGKTGIDGHTVDLDLPIHDSLKILELAGMLSAEVGRRVKLDPSDVPSEKNRP
jgi:hypothetical protein